MLLDVDILPSALMGVLSTLKNNFSCVAEQFIDKKSLKIKITNSGIYCFSKIIGLYYGVELANGICTYLDQGRYNKQGENIVGDRGGEVQLFEDIGHKILGGAQMSAWVGLWKQCRHLLGYSLCQRSKKLKTGMGLRGTTCLSIQANGPVTGYSDSSPFTER